MPTDPSRVLEVLNRINQTWLEGRPQEMWSWIHPDIIMEFPGFTGRIAGREAFVSGFVDFCEGARIIAYREADHQVDVIAEAAVASFSFEMTYEREASRFRSTGRDLWVFARQAGNWTACWRSMFDVREEPAPA